MYISFVFGGCYHAPFLWLNHFSARAVNGRSVAIQPFANFRQSVGENIGDAAIRALSDVEQQVGIAAGCVHQKMDEGS